MTVQDGWVGFDNDINSILKTIRGAGVISGWACSPSATNMSIDVAAGRGFVNKRERETTSVTTVLLSDGDATNPRKDIIIVDSTGSITKVEGTPEAAEPSGNTGPQTTSPKPPDIPADAIILAEVWVAAGKSGSVFQASDITDRRVMLPGLLAAERVLRTNYAYTLFGSGAYIEYDGEYIHLYSPSTDAIGLLNVQFSNRPNYELQFEIYAYVNPLANCYIFFMEPYKTAYDDFVGFLYFSPNYKVKVGTTQYTLTGQDWTTERHFRIKYKDNQVDFFVDGTNVKSVTTGIPSTGTNFKWTSSFSVMALEPMAGANTYMRYPPGIWRRKT